VTLVSNDTLNVHDWMQQAAIYLSNHSLQSYVLRGFG
jgi:hypothetical protein